MGSVDGSCLRMYLGTGNGYRSISSPITEYRDQVRRKYEFGNFYIKVNDSLVINSTKGTTAPQLKNYNLTLFGFNNTSGVRQKVYGIQIFEDDELIHDFIPMLRWADERIGLYDRVSGNFIVAPVNYTKGKILDPQHYTNNFEARINFDDHETTHHFIDEMSNNFKKIDTAHTVIKNKDTTLIGKLNNIDQKFRIDTNTKNSIIASFDNLFDIGNDGAQTRFEVAANIVNKLRSDYSKEQLDTIFATDQDLEERIDAICSTLMLNYYTIDELNDIITKGDGGSVLTDVYTKSEIQEKIPEKENMDIFHDIIASMTDFEENIVLFHRLNGKGE